MPDRPSRALVVEHAVASEAALLDHDGVHVVPAPGRRGQRLDADRVIDVLDEAGTDALVLSRPPWREPAITPIPALSVVLGRDLLWLPPDVAPAAWALALIASWARTTPADDLLPRAQVAVGLAAMPPTSLPTRAWGAGDVHVPAMSPSSIARWCDCAWQPCAWCDAGGMADAACPACGQREAGR